MFLSRLIRKHSKCKGEETYFCVIWVNQALDRQEEEEEGFYENLYGLSLNSVCAGESPVYHRDYLPSVTS